jgi:seryl-tRNA synthetase
MDFDAAAKIAGARFTVLKRRAGAAATRADPVDAGAAHVKQHGYVEASVPLSGQ